MTDKNLNPVIPELRRTRPRYSVGQNSAGRFLDIVTTFQRFVIRGNVINALLKKMPCAKQILCMGSNYFYSCVTNELTLHRFWDMKFSATGTQVYQRIILHSKSRCEILINFVHGGSTRRVNYPGAELWPYDPVASSLLF